jgi:CysZ protein
MFSAFKNFRFGFVLPWASSLWLWRHPTVVFWTFLPAVLSFGVAYFLLADVRDSLVALAMSGLLKSGLEPQSLAIQTASILLKIAGWLTTAIIFAVLTGVLSTPLADFLAESVEECMEPKLPAPDPSLMTFRGRMRLWRVDLVKSIGVTISQGLLLLSSLFTFWLPLVPALLLVLSAWILTFQYLSYAQTRRGYSWQQGVSWVLRHRMSCLGFGLSSLVLFSLPLLSFFALPLVVIGATRLAGWGYAKENAPK